MNSEKVSDADDSSSESERSVGALKMVLAGFAFGCLFVLVGTLVACTQLGEYSWSAVIAAQSSEPLLWIIDLAPIALATAAYFIKVPVLGKGASASYKFPLVLLGVTLAPVGLLFFALYQHHIATQMASDMNRAGSLRAHAYRIFIQTTTEKAGDWEPTLRLMRDERAGLRVRYPEEVALTDDAWRRFETELQTTKAL